ncbi:MAG: orotate phosphoribosyltransferase [Pseudonocardiaceae bacterium]
MTITASLFARIRATACQRGAFHLPTGQVIEEYFDEYLLAADPVMLRDIAAEMTRHVPACTEALVGLELGGLPLAVALSAATGVPAGFLRRKRKSYGTCRQVEGRPVTGRHVVLIDDVVRSGAQILRAASVLRLAGASVATAICVLDRGLNGRVRLAESRIELRSLLTSAALSTEVPVWQADQRPGPRPEKT